MTLNAGAITPDKDNQLSPAEWKRLLEENPDAVPLDIRNRFESDAGKFENAVVCDIEHFRELPQYVDRLQGLKDKTVLMYCTGGIRCEKASALFRSKGFKNVFQLHGGIAAYQEQFGNEHWQGECFVFDQRMTVRVEEGLVQIGRCAHTGRATSRFVNCLHDPCHKLFILSAEAEAENRDHQALPGVSRGRDHLRDRGVLITPALSSRAAQTARDLTVALDHSSNSRYSTPIACREALREFTRLRGPSPSARLGMTGLPRAAC